MVKCALCVVVLLIISNLFKFDHFGSEEIDLFIEFDDRVCTGVVVNDGVGGLDVRELLGARYGTEPRDLVVLCLTLLPQQVEL